MIATDRLDYALPQGQIAQTPADRRDGSRLLVVDRSRRSVKHRMFGELPSFLKAGDTLFRNNAAVLPARLHGQRSTGGKIECLLLRRLGDTQPGTETWECLVRPGRRMQPGAVFEAADGRLRGTVIALSGSGPVSIEFTSLGGESVVEAANRSGEVPLPPYIERSDGSRRAEDLERYQTVYADKARQVAAAAPTAGLHFTPELLARMESAGVRTADLTLHVGLGTFRPIATASVEEHPIHSEVYEVPVATQRLLFPPLTGRRIAVGTTTVRSVEDFLAGHSRPMDHPHVAEASIFIYPPRPFRGVDALITNFHQPRSTLLCLVAAFLTPGSEEGLGWLMEIYAEAVSKGYRFFSYGDSMLIL
ncbi:MAG TPA: tRNA preQ1(34) S-adenosylmethionine ribosyltransferase-isomerase QueA [Opitutaceae bacterium]